MLAFISSVFRPVMMLAALTMKSENSPQTARQVLDNSLQHLRHRTVRELAWAALSPNLIGSQALSTMTPQETEELLCSDPEEAWRFLKKLDADPKHLTEWMGVSDRLGRKFEALVEFWLKNCPCSAARHLLKPHTQVQDSKGVTIGEADYVFQDPKAYEQWWHLETSIGYFVYVGGELGYLGPHRKHTLGDRIRRAKRQLKLVSDNPVSQEVLGLPLNEVHRSPSGFQPSRSFSVLVREPFSFSNHHPLSHPARGRFSHRQSKLFGRQSQN
mmetsp:Transcript_2936/g.4779  ORF Transcript_2936/g.4779 Transcript_2936/m.4779 type:complete len:271 (+) Transcript_2936:168-980(+)